MSCSALDSLYLRSHGANEGQLGRSTADDRRSEAPGVVALKVRCQRPCKRIGSVSLDALRLSDDTVIAQISKLRRLRCEACDRVPDLAPIWPVQTAEPAGAADLSSTRWILTAKGADGRTGTSSPLWSRQHALRFAREQIAQGDTVLRIETPTGRLGAAEE